jgi:hypothetical protein
MREPAPLPQEFRPSGGLRAVSAFFGLVCAAGAAGSLLLFLQNGGSTRLAAFAVLAGPALLAAGLARRKMVVRVEGLVVRGILRTRDIPWDEVLAVEQTRRSFVIITEKGDVSGGWITPDRRDLLFRKVLELARLALEPREQRWGIIARFVRSGPPSRITPAELLRTHQPNQRPKE